MSRDPTIFNPGSSIGHLCKHIYRLSLVQLEEAFAEETITYLQWAVLISILNRQGTTCKNLARDLAHDTGATSRLVDTLERRQLVVRVRDPDDRRAVNLTLTEAGRTLTERCSTGVLDLWNGWLAGWDPAEIVQLIGYLQRLQLDLEASTERDAADTRS